MTRMQSLVLPLVAALLISVAGPSLAQTNLKIGFVNVPFLIQNSPRTAAVEQRLRNEFAEREADLQAMIEDFQDKQESLERNADVMPASERTSIDRDLGNLQREIQRRGDDLQEDINFRQNELLNELQSAMLSQIQTFAEDEGYDLIVTNVVYVSDSIDITDEVLAAIAADESDD
jgi:outer membrane protein